TPAWCCTQTPGNLSGSDTPPSLPQDAVRQEPGHTAHQTARRRTDKQRQDAVHKTRHTDDLPAPQRRQGRFDYCLWCHPDVGWNCRHVDPSMLLELGVCEARTEGLHAHPRPTEFLVQGFCEAIDEGFRGTICGVVGTRHEG